MLYITYKTKESNFKETAPIGEWHVGEPLPKVPMGVRVLHFQTDGHELECLLSAMSKTSTL